jgi:CBS domain-containing protein
MSQGVVTVGVDDTVAKFVAKTHETTFSGLPVVDGAGKAVGVVSQNDVLRALAFVCGGEDLPGEFLGDPERHQVSTRLVDLAKNEGRGVAVEILFEKPVQEIMTPEVISCRAEAELAEVCQTMTQNHIHRVVVLDDAGVPVGMISATDLVRAFGKSLAG